MELLDIILKGLGNKKSGLEKPKVFKKLFPKIEYDEQKLHNVMSYLKKLFFRFISIQHFEKQDFQEPLMTLEAAFSNNQFGLLKNRGKQFEKELAKYPYQGSDYFYANYRLNNIMGFYFAVYEDRSQSMGLQRMLDNLDRYYIIEKLRNCSQLTANMMALNTRYTFHFLDELLHYIKNNWSEYEQDTTIVLYYTILMSLREDNDPEHFLKLKEILVQHFEELTEEEQRNLYTFANNYCVLKINQGHSDYQRELFQLYKQGLKTGLILDNGTLNEFIYKNITALGCSLKEFEWTENFIQEYKSLLIPHRRENAYNYNLAHFYYSTQMYQDALSALLLVQFTDVKYHLNTTFLLLRTYYALRDTEALLSLIETFRIYVIRNQQTTTDQKRGYTNFLRFAKKLVLLKHQAHTYSKNNLHTKLEVLANKIEQTNNVINRYWLLEECRA
ncbi:MAG: hypothetical protein DHS20C18_30290 [Saprospiraceae bacterium]|nr:MAG: hypothetical protein DHS20C18_30290 [Saprospiraceae bacterium]